MSSIRKVPLIPFDSLREETVGVIVKSLDALRLNSESIFQRAGQRLDQSASRISSLQGRVGVLSKKIDALAEINETPLLCSLSTYPDAGRTYIRAPVFDSPASMTPSSTEAGITDPPAYPSTSNSGREFGHKAPSFHYVFARPKYSELRLPGKKEQAPSRVVEGLLSEELLLLRPRQRRSPRLKRHKGESDAESLLALCEFPGDASPEQFSFDSSNVFTGESSRLAGHFDFPDLPLPGAVHHRAPANHLHGSTSSGGPKVPGEGSLFSLARSNLYINASEAYGTGSTITPLNSTATPISLEQDGDIGATPSPKILTANGTLSPPPSSRPTAQQPSSGATIDVPSSNSPRAIFSPPPPAPPPPPVVSPASAMAISNGIGATANHSQAAELSKGHTDLMEAIRRAGGTERAKLRKVAVIEENSSTAVPKVLPSTTEGDDLMSSLAKALELRRRGISGKNKHRERPVSTKKGVGQVDEAFSRLRQTIPPPRTFDYKPQPRDITENGDDEWH